MQYLIATTFEVVHYIALQAVHYKPLQEVHLSRYNHVDKDLAFYAIIDGVKKGAQDLINEEYEIMNDAGIILDIVQAYRVSDKILKPYKQA